MTTNKWLGYDKRSLNFTRFVRRRFSNFLRYVCEILGSTLGSTLGFYDFVTQKRLEADPLYLSLGRFSATYIYFI